MQLLAAETSHGWSHFHCQPDELVVIHGLAGERDPSKGRPLLQLCQKTTQALCEVFPEDLSGEWVPPYLRAGGRLLIKMKMPDDEIGDFTGVGDWGGCHRPTVERLETWTRELACARDQLIPSFAVEQGHLLGLGPTIQRLSALGHRVFFLDVPGKPRPALVKAVRSAFEFLEMVGVFDVNIYFSFLSPDFKEWSLRTGSTFGNLQHLHIDLSNKCTHSCHFCGLYSQDAWDRLPKEPQGGALPRSLTELMSRQADARRIFETLERLPWTVSGIQFGGMGDPLMHPQAFDFIETARRRGICVEILTNLEYLDDARIERLHLSGGHFAEALHLIVNISAADAETYVRTRPRQKSETFAKVKRHLQRLGDLRRADGERGAYCTLMCVITRMNFREVVKMVRLGAEVGAHSVWFKPFEQHAEWMKMYQLDRDEFAEYKEHLREALALADRLNVRIWDRPVAEHILRADP